MNTTKITDFNQNTLQVDSTGVLLVKISIDPRAVELKNLTSTLENYIQTYGGQGSLHIQIVYQDKNGVYQKWNPKKQDDK